MSGTHTQFTLWLASIMSCCVLHLMFKCLFQSGVPNLIAVQIKWAVLRIQILSLTSQLRNVSVECLFRSFRIMDWVTLNENRRHYMLKGLEKNMCTISSGWNRIGNVNQKHESLVTATEDHRRFLYHSFFLHAEFINRNMLSITKVAIWTRFWSQKRYAAYTSQDSSLRYLVFCGVNCSWGETKNRVKEAEIALEWNNQQKKKSFAECFWAVDFTQYSPLVIIIFYSIIYS